MGLLCIRIAQGEIDYSMSDPDPDSDELFIQMMRERLGIPDKPMLVPRGVAPRAMTIMKPSEPLPRRRHESAEISGA